MEWAMDSSPKIIRPVKLPKKTFVSESKKWLKTHHKSVLAAVSVVVIGGSLLGMHLLKHPKSNLASNTITLNTSSKTLGNSNAASPKSVNNDNIVNWTKSVSATDNSVSLDGTIIEEIKPNQVFNGNVDLPKGWTVAYSTDDSNVPAESRTYSATAPSDLTLVHYLKITTGVADGFKPYAQAPLVQPLDAKPPLTEGQRPLAPILYKDKVFQVLRAVKATGTSYSTMDCFDLTTYARCTQATFPTYFSSGGTNTAPTTLGTGSRDISTPYNMQHVLDEDTGKLYLPGQQLNNYGVTCVDLINFQNCGFNVLGSSPAPIGSVAPEELVSNPVLVSGFVRNGDKIYGHANDADKTTQTVVCFDIKVNAICPGYTSATTMPANIPTYDISEHNQSYNTPGVHVMSGTRMFWNVNYRVGNTRRAEIIWAWTPDQTTQRDLGTRIACFDVATKAACTGWTPPTTFYDSPGLERPYALFLWKQANNTDYGICLSAGIQVSFDPGMNCYNPLTSVRYNGGNNIGFPKLFPAQWLLVPWTMGQYITTITDGGHTKSYFPMYKTGDNNTSNAALNATPSKGATICFDWDTQDYCSGFPPTKYWHDVNSGYSGDVGYAYDGSCMWAVGYTGYIWAFNAKTGETPCRVARTKYTASFNANDFYCDATNRAFHWGKARLSKSSMYNFESFGLTIKNADGSVAKVTNLKDNDQTLDLSDIPYDANNPLTVEVNSTVYNTSPWANNALPFIDLVANASDFSNGQPASDDVEYCYQTKVKDQCDTSLVQTASDVLIKTPTDTIASGGTKTMPVVQPSDVQCFKDLKVSVSSSASQVRNNQNITYTVKVDNKANKDAEGRGDIPSAFNSATAQIEATIPSGMTYVSSSNGGTKVGNKIVWTNQGIPAFESIDRTVTLKAPASGVAFASPAKKGVVYAATTQQPLTMTAEAIYGDDVYQSDNTTQDSSVTFMDTTPPTVSLAASSNSVTNPSGYTITATAGDTGGSVKRIEISENGSIANTCIDTTTCVFTVSGAVSAGTYTYTATAYDNSSPQASTTSNTQVVTVSDPVAINNPPSVTLSVPGTTLVTPAFYDVDATASDSDGTISKIEIYRGGVKVQTCTATTSCRVSMAISSESSYTFYAKAYDSDNPVASSTSTSKTVFVNNSAPAITVNSSSASVVAGSAYSVTATGSDNGQTLAKIEIIQNGTVVRTCNNANLCNYGTGTSTTAGSYTYTAKAYDADGNNPLTTTSSSTTVTVTPPNVAPNANIAVSSSSVLTTDSFAVTGSGDDSDGSISKIEILQNGVVVRTCLPAVSFDQDTQQQIVVNASPCTYNASNYSATSYYFRVRVYDNATPVASTYSSYTTVNVSAPVFVPDPNDFQLTLFLTTNVGVAPADYIVAANLRDTDVAIPKIEILEDSTIVKTCLQAKTCEYPATSRNAGSYQYYARGYGPNGVASTTPTQVALINLPPEPAPNQAPTVSTNVSGNNYTAPADFNVTATANDNDGNITRIEILQGGVIAKTCTNVASCVFTATNYTAGSYSFSSKAYDNGTPNAVTTSSSQVVTVADPTPVVVPTPTANLRPIAAMEIIDSRLTAPGYFKIKATARDPDGTIAKLQIRQSGVTVVECLTSDSCTYTANNVTAGSYGFAAYAYDNSGAEATTLTQVIEITQSVGTASASSAGGQTGTKRTAVESIAVLPQLVGETLGVALDASARSVEPVSPAVARAVPYTTISLIFVFSAFYFMQAFNQAHSQQVLSDLSKRFKRTKENRKNYIDLTSHYISTPIATMSSTLELQDSQHSVPQKVLNNVKVFIGKLRKDSQDLLTSSQVLSEESDQVAQTLGQYNKVSIFKNPSFVVPLASVLLIVVLSNAVFIRADKYSASIVNIILQGSFFALAVGSLVVGYNSLRKQKYAYELADKEYNLEQEINKSQAKFISDTSKVLSDDVKHIEEYAPTIEKASHGENFNSGLKSLKKAVTKLAYLDQLTTSSVKVKTQNVNLNSLVEDVFKTYRPIALQSQINLRTDIEPEVIANVDPQGFKYILISVLDNAIKFTKPGGDVKVTLKNLNKKYATLRVQDTGAGIPKSKVDKLFAPFSRATDTLKFDYEGLGLDLYMDKLITEQAGGKIDISSIEGAYTTVTVKLPKK